MIFDKMTVAKLVRNSPL